MPKRLGILSLALLLLAWPAARSSAFLIRVVSGTTITQAITGVALSGSNYTSGASVGTVVGAVSVTMLPSLPTFSGTLSVSGAAAADFSLSSATLPANLITNSSTATCSTTTTYNINIVATQGGVNGSPFTQAETITCNPNQTVSSVALNFVPQGNYTSGSGAVASYDLYFTGGCTNGTQIGSLVATTSGGAYAGSWTLTGTNASSFTVTGSNPGALKCNGTVATGSYSFNAVAGTNSYSQAITAYAGQTYYMSPTGSDSNAGTSSGSPWATPNHSLKCGDFIIAATGSYSSNQMDGEFGAVTCAGAPNVAWVKCATAFACTVPTGSAVASVWVNSRFWGVQGWETSNSSGNCYTLRPGTATTPNIYVAIANDIADVCLNNGIDTEAYNGSVGPAGNDYSALIGNLAYGSAGGTGECFSNMSMAGESNYDSVVTTHRYVAWNISWKALDGSGCAGGSATSDGEGLILDSPQFAYNCSDTSCLTSPVDGYDGFTVVENNLFIANGGAGFQQFVNANPASGSNVLNLLTRYNTAWDNNLDPNRTSIPTELEFYGPPGNTYMLVTAEYNITGSPNTTCCSGGVGIVSMYDQDMNTSGLMDYNSMYVSGGNATTSPIVNWVTGYTCGSGSPVPSPGGGSNNNDFCANSIVNTNPNFVSATIPGAPSCSGQADTLACMATTRSNFVAQASGMTSWGFQTTAPSDANNTPTWICNIERALPSDMNPHC